MDKTSLGDRMKAYERVSSSKLIRRTPVIIRLDGKAFHTYTKYCDKPFDDDLHQIRQDTLSFLCRNIQGVVMGYSQSDEISLVLKDWQTFNTDPWFDNKVQKIVSVSASMCTGTWNKLARLNDRSKPMNPKKFSPFIAYFDSRAFNICIYEVVNYLIWRQQDWERNSVQMLARSKYSAKECHGKSCGELLAMLDGEHNIVWGELPIHQKRGEFWLKGEGLIDCPIFKFAYTRALIEDMLHETSDE